MVHRNARLAPAGRLILVSRVLPEHPLAKAIVAYADTRKIPRRTASAFRNIAGKGAIAPSTAGRWSWTTHA
ncbi:hypothetical protein [Gryllotalpicola sp.]|uniref:hypothetical protein n=1 Tax=Gryllotalpicola sp. TaxID=1932787 RepID=UPI00261659FD|nr:hypothetical protein [Gryllotalpicola sp.]